MVRTHYSGERGDQCLYIAWVGVCVLLLLEGSHTLCNKGIIIIIIIFSFNCCSNLSWRTAIITHRRDTHTRSIALSNMLIQSAPFTYYFLLLV